MNTQEAKETLFLYRPGTADAEDPAFADALELCEKEPDLRQWFNEHCAVYTALRFKLKEIPVPEGLREQILAERPVNLPVVPHRRSLSLLAAAAAIALVATVALFWTLGLDRSPLPAFRDRMVNKAFRVYTMDLESSQAEAIRGYLSQRGAPADFTLPSGLNNASMTGCVATEWHGNPVSMVCFASQEAGPAAKTDLWLFVVRSTAAPGAPPLTKPRLTEGNGVATATWSQNDKTFVLVMEGTASKIRKFL